MSDPAEIIIEAQDLVKDFPMEMRGYRIRAVENLSFSAKKGRVMGLMGPNGSGKSTTIKMTLGLVKPTAGEISLLGKKPTERIARKAVGYLPEAPYFYRFLSGMECVRMMGKLSGLRGSTLEARSRFAVEMVGLTTAAERRVGTYSKGMLQRIGLAQAIVHDPDLLILDEPTAGVDPIGTVEMAERIVELKNAGKSIILCSHLLSDIEGICDDLLMLYKGKTLYHGATRDLLETDDIWHFRAKGERDPSELDAKRALEAAGFRWISANRGGESRLSDAFVERIKEVDTKNGPNNVEVES